MKKKNVNQVGGLKNNKMSLKHLKLKIKARSYDILLIKLEDIYNSNSVIGKKIHTKCMYFIQLAQTKINNFKKLKIDSEQLLFAERNLIFEKINNNKILSDDIKGYLKSVIHALFSNETKQIYLIIDLDSHEVLRKSYNFEALKKKLERNKNYHPTKTVIATAAQLRQLKYERKEKGRRILNMFNDNEEITNTSLENLKAEKMSFDSIINNIINTGKNDIPGVEKKIIKIMEELGELSEGYLKLTKYKFTTDTEQEIKDNLREETADLFIMIMLIANDLGISMEELQAEICVKIAKWKNKIQLNKDNIPQNNFKNSVDLEEYEKIKKCYYCNNTHYNGHFKNGKYWIKKFTCGLVLEGFFVNNSHVINQTYDCKNRN